jgi:hypothetical protein
LHAERIKRHSIVHDEKGKTEPEKGSGKNEGDFRSEINKESQKQQATGNVTVGRIDNIPNGNGSKNQAREVVNSWVRDQMGVRDPEIMERR